MQIPFYRGIDVENAIKLAAADDGYVTYDELRENLRKYEKITKKHDFPPSQKKYLF